MKESWLHFVWLQRCFKPNGLTTTCNKNLEIIQTGKVNLYAGPDFSESQIQLEDILLCGNIEIHTITQDWYAHKHHKDPAYNSVILHVVYESSLKKVITENGNTLPELELKSVLLHPIETLHFRDLRSLIMPCSPFLPLLSADKKNEILLSYFKESLYEKLDMFKDLLQECKGDLERTFFIGIGMYCVDPGNRESFKSLCKSIDLAWIKKKREKPLLVEAMVFGMAGILQAHHSNDVYFQQLCRQFKILQQIHDLFPLNNTFVKKGGARPEGNSRLRLAWLCALVQNYHTLSDVFYYSESLFDMTKHLDIKLSSYWEYHFDFSQMRKKAKSTILGDDGKNQLLINAILPVCLLRAEILNEKQKSAQFFEYFLSLSPENNRIVRSINHLGIETKNAAHSQSVLYLNKYYCSQYRCVDCKLAPLLLPQH